MKFKNKAKFLILFLILLFIFSLFIKAEDRINNFKSLVLSLFMYNSNEVKLSGINIPNCDINFIILKYKNNYWRINTNSMNFNFTKIYYKNLINCVISQIKNKHIKEIEIEKITLRKFNGIFNLMPNFNKFSFYIKSNKDNKIELSDVYIEINGDILSLEGELYLKLFFDEDKESKIYLNNDTVLTFYGGMWQIKELRYRLKYNIQTNEVISSEIFERDERSGAANLIKLKNTNTNEKIKINGNNYSFKSLWRSYEIVIEDLNIKYEKAFNEIKVNIGKFTSSFNPTQVEIKTPTFNVEVNNPYNKTYSLSIEKAALIYNRESKIFYFKDGIIKTLSFKGNLQISPNEKLKKDLLLFFYIDGQIEINSLSNSDLIIKNNKIFGKINIKGERVNVRFEPNENFNYNCNIYFNIFPLEIQGISFNISPSISKEEIANDFNLRGNFTLLKIGELIQFRNGECRLRGKLTDYLFTNKTYFKIYEMKIRSDFSIDEFINKLDNKEIKLLELRGNWGIEALFKDINLIYCKSENDFSEKWEYKRNSDKYYFTEYSLVNKLGYLFYIIDKQNSYINFYIKNNASLYIRLNIKKMMEYLYVKLKFNDINYKISLNSNRERLASLSTSIIFINERYSWIKGDPIIGAALRPFSFELDISLEPVLDIERGYIYPNIKIQNLYRFASEIWEEVDLRGIANLLALFVDLTNDIENNLKGLLDNIVFPLKIK